MVSEFKEGAESLLTLNTMPAVATMKITLGETGKGGRDGEAGPRGLWDRVEHHASRGVNNNMTVGSMVGTGEGGRAGEGSPRVPYNKVEDSASRGSDKHGCWVDVGYAESGKSETPGRMTHCTRTTWQSTCCRNSPFPTRCYNYSSRPRPQVWGCAALPRTATPP